MRTQIIWRRLLEAALDQPNPTDALKSAIQDALTITNHPDRDRSRDVQRAQRGTR